MESYTKKAKIFKSMLSIFLSVLLALSPIFVYAAGDELDESMLDGVDMSSTLGLGESDGASEENLILVEVSTEAELRAIAERVNGGDNMAGHIVKLKNHINISGKTDWVPIGNDALKPFSGVFDGQGFTISGLKVKADVKGGLFGYLVDAKIKGLTLADFAAYNSTGGIFYSAVRTAIDMSRSENNGVMAMMFRSPFSVADTWDGTADISWYTGFPDEYTIDTAEKLAGLSDLVAGGQDFAGSTIIIDKDFNMNGYTWTSIGDVFTSVPFRGRFIGNGYTITGLDNSLFGHVEKAVITKVVIDGADINNTSSGGMAVGVGAFANWAEGSDISQIYIKNSTIVGENYDFFGTSKTGSGGVVGIVTSDIKSSSISKIFVENTHVTGDINAGGIAGYIDAASVTECVVYGGSITNTGTKDTSYGNTTGGIAGTFLNVNLGGSMKDCLVMGTDFGNDNYFAGLSWSQSYKVTFSDSIVSNIKTQNTNLADPEVYLGVGSTPTVGGVQNLFTDSSLGFKFVSDPDTYPGADGISGIYWDNLGDRQNNPISGVHYNQAMSTATLTNGTWTPSEDNWVATKNFYPQIKPLSTKTWNELVPVVSAAASIALVPGNADENYVTGAGQLLLPNTVEVDGMGQMPITWTGYSSLVPDQLTATSTSEGTLLTAKLNTVTGINLTAEVGGYKKQFDSVEISDTVLEFNNSVPKNGDVVDANTTNSIKVVFTENIAENPLAAGKLAKLQVLRGTDYVTLEVIPLDSASTTKYSVAANSKEANFTISSLQPGQTYRMVIPAEAVTQDGNTKALSKDIEINFSTVENGKPIISFKNDLSFSVDYDLKVSDLLANIVVKDFDQTGMYDGENPSTSAVVPQEYTGSAWNSKDVEKSLQDIISVMPNGSIYYVVVDKTILNSSTREAGIYEFYVAAKNPKGKAVSKVMTFTIKGYPDWLKKPEPVVHIQWTTNKQTVIDAAMQNAVATIKQKNGNALPCLVTVDFSEDDWNKILNVKKGPSTLNTVVTASDSSGGSAPGSSVISVPVTVYLDDPLYWTITPSPVTMYLSTKSQVEKKINMMVRGRFDKDDLIFEHWENNYRKPGTYYVDVYSEEQHTTNCGLVDCNYAGHPSDHVDDTFIVNIVDTPGFAIPTFWGITTAKLLSYVPEENGFESSYVYSKNIVEVSPSNYRLPSFVPEALRTQTFGRMEINYDNYRWNLYSNTLDTSYLWSDEYNLEATMSKVSDKLDNAVQINFAHSGRLFGAVEFDVNMDKLGDIAPNLPKQNLGLYRYDGLEKKLVLVSNVVVEDGKWASSLVKEIYPTTYVLKSRGTSDVVNENSFDGLTNFYKSTKVLKDGVVSAGDAKLVTLPTNAKDFDAVYYADAETSGNKNSQVIIAGISAVAVIGAVAAAVLYIRKRREEI